MDAYCDRYFMFILLFWACVSGCNPQTPRIDTNDSDILKGNARTRHGHLRYEKDHDLSYQNDYHNKQGLPPELDITQDVKEDSSIILNSFKGNFHISDILVGENQETNKSEDTDDLPSYCSICMCNRSDKGLMINCARKSLSYPFTNVSTATYWLSYAHNNMTGVEYDHFAGLGRLYFLDLSFNQQLMYIDTGTFRDLDSLDTLLLNSNGFMYIDDFMYTGIFIGLKNLRYLTLDDNMGILPNYASINGKAFEDVPRLEILHIDGYSEVVFNKSFLITNLIEINMSTQERRSFGQCEIHRLVHLAFEGVPHLHILSLKRCQIFDIEPGTFMNFHALEYLDLSYNDELGIDAVSQIAKELVPYHTVKVLVLNNIVSDKDSGWRLTATKMTYVNQLPITELYMDYNNIAILDYDSINVSANTLQVLTMRRNLLFLTEYIGPIIFYNPAIQIFDYGNQNPPAKECFNCSTPRYRLHGSRSKGSVTKLDLKTFIFTNSIIYHAGCVDFSDSINEIRTMILSGNYYGTLWAHCYANLRQLELLDLSSGSISDVDKEHALSGLCSLKTLLLQNNRFGEILHTKPRLFSNLTNLRSIDLSSNEIQTLDPNVLYNSKNLTEINISGNKLHYFQMQVSLNPNLKLLNLSNNPLQTIASKTRTQLSDIAEHHGIKVDLSRTRLDCSCNNRDFLRWLFTTKVHFINLESYVCVFSNRSTGLLYPLIAEQLDEECKTYHVTIIVSTALIAVFLSVLAVGLGHRYRWHLIYLYYIYRQKQTNHKHGEDEFECDTFISFADEDAAFVSKDMLQELEKKRNVRLHIRHRDFRLGEINAINISNAVKLSRKTILLLSANFFQNQWCNFEMNMAQMEGIYSQRSVIVIVILGDIPGEHVSRQIVDMMRKCKTLQVPEEGRAREAFWEQLASYLRE